MTVPLPWFINTHQLAYSSQALQSMTVPLPWFINTHQLALSNHTAPNLARKVNGMIPASFLIYCQISVPTALTVLLHYSHHPCSDFIDMLRRLISCGIIIIIKQPNSCDWNEAKKQSSNKHSTTYNRRQKTVQMKQLYSLKVLARRRVSEWESEVVEIPVVGIIDVDVADRHVVKHTVVRVDDHRLTAGLRRTVIGTLNDQCKLLHRPLLRLAVVTDVHTQSVRLEAECRASVVVTLGYQASFVFCTNKNTNTARTPRLLELANSLSPS